MCSCELCRTTSESRRRAEMALRSGRVSVTIAQVSATRSVVEWYLKRYFRSADDPGLLPMFCDAGRVGAFAISAEEVAERDSPALFRLLVGMTMFQRRQDLQIMRILRGIGRRDADELASVDRLASLVKRGPCELMRTTQLLHERCDLTKDPRTRLGMCSANPDAQCHLKRHTVLLKRYGHFGKVPTSSALALLEAGHSSVGALAEQIARVHRSRLERSQAFEAALSRAWRVNQKRSE